MTEKKQTWKIFLAACAFHPKNLCAPSAFLAPLRSTSPQHPHRLREKVAELNEQGRSPVYLVHFTQSACADAARDLLSTNFCTKEEKHAIAREVDSNKNSIFTPEIGMLTSPA